MLAVRSRRRLLVVAAVALLPCGGLVFAGEEPPAAGPNEKSPQLVEEVQSGKRAVANAAWWGFDEKDATEALQAALDSKAPTVIVPNLGKDWIVARTIRLPSDKEIVFRQGVVVAAMRGKFLGRGEPLMLAADVKNLTLRGDGATFRMHKADYHKPPYQKAEWRHTLSIRGSSGVKIYGLTLLDSGGDGIYLGTTARQNYCKDVHIRGVACDGHNRQGLSVISAENLLVEDCRFDNTAGTAPQAGIDLEPNAPGERLVNCTIRNCTVTGNAGPGMFVYLRPLDRSSRDLSVRFESCTVRNGGSFGIGGGTIKDDGPAGFVEFNRVTVEGCQGPGCYVYDKSADRAAMRFVQCTLKDVARKHGSPILISRRRPEMAKRPGGVELRDCRVEDDRKRACLVVAPGGTNLGNLDIRGTITVKNPHGVSLAIEGGTGAGTVQVKLVAEKE